MTADMMVDSDLLSKVRELRAGGRTPKQIAQTLGIRPAVVAPLVRTVARQEAATQLEPAVVGCWVSPGWSAGLTVKGHEAGAMLSTATEALKGSPASSWPGGIGRSGCQSADIS